MIELRVGFRRFEFTDRDLHTNRKLLHQFNFKMSNEKKNGTVSIPASIENAGNIQETNENLENTSEADRSENRVASESSSCTREPYRAQENYDNGCPGVYYVDGDCQVELASPLENSHENFQIERSTIYADSYAVLCVEAEIITCFSHRRKNLFLIFLTIMILFATSIFLLQSHTKNKSIYMSPSQSNSLAPSSTDFDYVKQILIPISGEDVLDDPKSLQHYIWQKISSNLWFHRDQGDFNVRDERKIIQRYAIFVVVMSMTLDLTRYNESRIFDRKFPDECTFFSCNDLGEITLLIIQNERTTDRGGGIIAKEIGALHGLTHLILKKNSLHGEIPSEIGQLKSLQLLDLQENNLTGSIPTEIGQLKNMSWIFLNKNKLTGTIPMEMSNFVDMFYADLSENNLMGSIPLSFSELSNLKGFALHQNNLSGDISFLCEVNFTNDPYFRDEYLGISLYIEYSYEYSVNLSLTVDCEYEDTHVFSCSCCACAH